MLSRISLALASALAMFVGATGVANAASDRTEVGVGTAIVVVIAMVVISAIYGVKVLLGGVNPPPIPPGGLPYHSLPAGGDVHGHDSHGGGHH
jgi:hypothetical protein